MKRLIPHALLASLAGLAQSAGASTMPRADLGGRNNYFGIGLGNGVSASVDLGLTRQLTLGGSIGTGLLGYSEPNRYDIRLLYDFIAGGRHNLSVAGIIGLWGGSYWSWANTPFNLAPGIEVGVGLAYPFTPRFTGRLNLVVPYYGITGGPYYNYWGGPSGGLELAYKFQPHLEGTLGTNGQGNLLGLKLDF